MAIFCKLCKWALWHELWTWGISLGIYSAVTCVLATGHTRHIFLWNVLISLHRSWCQSSWQLKFSRSLCLHSYFISNSYTFSYKSDIISSCWHLWCKLDVLAFQWKVNHWRVERGKGMSPGSATFSSPQITSKLASLANYFFSFLPQFGAWSHTKPLPLCGYIYQFTLILDLELRAQNRFPANRGLFSPGIRQAGVKETAHQILATCASRGQNRLKKPTFSCHNHWETRNS